MIKLGNIMDRTISNYARIIYIINLQRIANILADKSIWAFSLINDLFNHYEQSYFDNHIHFYRTGVIHNIHIMTIPMHE